MKRKIISIMLISTLIIAILINVTYAETQSELQDQLNDASEQKKQAQSELTTIQTEKTTASSDLNSIVEKVNTAQSELDEINAKISDLNESIKSKQAEITGKETQIEAKTELLKERMVTLYEAGDTTYLDVLVNSDNLLDFISGYSVIEQIAEADTDLIKELNSEKEELEAAKQDLENSKTEVEVQRQSQISKTAELKSLKSEKEEQVATLSADEQAKQAELDEYDKAMERVNQKLKEIATKAQTQTSGLKFDGSFVWPCNNKIVTSGMKMRWGRLHKGIDIGASYENVYASASGYAYKAYDAGGYGYYIMIFHGDGYVTLYGHLSAYKITDGQYVSQGTVIATSGNSGSSQGAHLHFEIRKASSVYSFFNTSPLNPLDYLPGGYTLAAGALTES